MGIGAKSRTCLLAMLTGCALLAGGCASRREPPPVLPAPAVRVGMMNFNGTGLAGPRAVPATNSAAAATHPSDSPADALAVHFTAVTLLESLGEKGRSVGEIARLIVSQRDDLPVLPSTRLTVGSRLATGEAAANLGRNIRDLPASAAVVMADETTALPDGTTASIWLQTEGGTELPRFQVGVSRVTAPEDTQELELSIGLFDRIAIMDEDADDEAKPAGADTPTRLKTALRREVAIVRLPASTSEMTVLAPVRFGQHPGRVVAVLIHLTPGSDDPTHTLLVKEARTRIAEAIRDAGKPPPDPASLAARGAVESTVIAVQDPKRRLAALSLLAATSNAPIAADVILLAQDATLEQFAKRVTDQSAAMPPETTSNQWGLALDLMALSILAEFQSNNQIAPEMDAILAIHTGEAGRHAGTIDDIVKGVARRSDLDSRLIAENYIYLEDQSPAARVRAYDWLASRGKAPPGYDPLGDPRSRRAALDKTLAATTQPTQS